MYIRIGSNGIRKIWLFVGVNCRSGKISLPARMTDLYQSYPDDVDGITIPSVPEIVLTRPSIVSECSGENSSRQSENSNN